MQPVLLLLTKKKTGDLQAAGGLPVGGGVETRFVPGPLTSTRWC